MFGLGIALIIVLFQIFVFKKTWIETFPRATKFLFWWYVIMTSSIGLVLAVLTAVNMAMMGTLFTISPFGRGESPDPLFPLLMGGVILVPFLLQVIGAKLLQYAVKVSPDGSRSWRYFFIPLGLVPIGIAIYLFPFAS